MTTATTPDTWIESKEIADQPSAKDAREFFGVPPDPEAKLDGNIARKRRAWRAKVRSRKPTPEAKAEVEAVLKLIDLLAKYLKRGHDGPIDLGELNDIFREAPKAKIGELADLWELVERLLAAGKLDEALKVGFEARERFADSVVPHAVFAWVAAMASRELTGADDRLREEALRSAEIAVADADATPEAFWARAVLQLDLRRGAEALAGLEAAEQRLDGGLNAVLEVLLVEAYVAGDRIEDAVKRAIDAVEADPNDHAVRSTVALSLANAIQYSLLPIRTAADLARYQRVVEVAAWCAQGAPEAEDIVRPFRMWAVVADNRLYSGDVMRRAYAGVLTAFLVLPLLNRLRSKQQWQIVIEGPESVSAAVFAEVALGGVVRAVHQPIKDRLSWWDAYMAQWRDYETNNQQGGQR